MVLRIIALGCFGYLLLTACETWAEKPPAAIEEVAVTVGDEPIYAAEVMRLLGKVTRGAMSTRPPCRF